MRSSVRPVDGSAQDSGVGKAESPGRCCRPGGQAHLPGRLGWTDPPSVERRAVAFDSTCSHRPSRSKRGGRCRVADPTPVARPRTRCHRFTLTRSPEPSVLVPMEPPSPRPVGVAPDPSAPTTAPSPAVSRRPGCLATAPARRSCLRRPNAAAGPRLHPPPEGGRWPGRTRRPPRSPGSAADSS